MKGDNLMSEVLVRGLGPNPFKVGTFVRDRILHANPISKWMGKEEQERVRTILETIYPNNVFFREGWFIRILSTDSFNEEDADNFGLYMVRGVNIGKTILNEDTYTDVLEKHEAQDMGKCIFHIPDMAHKYGSFIILEDVITQSFRHMSSVWNPDGTRETNELTDREKFWGYIQETVYEDLKDFVEVMILSYINRFNIYPYDMLRDNSLKELLTGFNYYSTIVDRKIENNITDEETKIQRIARPMMYQLAEYEAWVVSTDMFTEHPEKHDKLMETMKCLDENENSDPAITLVKLIQIIKTRKNGEEK